MPQERRRASSEWRAPWHGARLPRTTRKSRKGIAVLGLTGVLALFATQPGGHPCGVLFLAGLFLILRAVRQL